MLVAIYIRVSSRKQLQGESLEDQLDACRTYITRMGWTEARVYVEPGRSAFTENLDQRTAFQELRADAKAGKFNIVLVYKLNRFARKVLVQYQVAAELERYQIQIASATQPIDRKTVGGRINFGVLAVLAEAQSDELSAVMKDKRLNEARKGRHVGPLPCGYGRNDQGFLVPNSDRAAPPAAFACYRQGDRSFRRVALELNEAGYTNRGRPFTTFGVEEMLKNPVYIGTVRCKGYTHPNAHEPLIDHETWEAVQALIARRGARTVSVRGTPRVGATGLLTNLAYCAHCGAKMWHQPHGGTRYYRCASVASAGSCGAKLARADDVELITLATLSVLALPVDWLTEAAEEIRRQASPTTRPATNRAALEARIKRLARLYEDGLKTDEEYETELKALRRQLEQEGAVEAEDSPALVDGAVRLLANLTDLLRAGPVPERREFLVQCVEQVLIKRHSVVAIRPVGLIAPLLVAANARLSDDRWRQMCVEWAGRGSNPRPSV